MLHMLWIMYGEQHSPGPMFGIASSRTTENLKITHTADSMLHCEMRKM